MNQDSLVIHRTFSESARRYPDKAALCFKKDNQWFTITYRDLEASSHKVAAFLIRQGFKKGDFAALVLENRPEWAVIYLGIMYAGLACVPLDRQLNRQEIDNLILDSGARIIFSSQAIFTEKFKVQAQNYSLKFVLVDYPGQEEQAIINFADIEEIKPDMSLFPEVSSEDVASLIYTSGTTAKPKGVLLSHRNICSNFRSVQALNICNRDDNILSILPLHHTYAFMVTLIVPLFWGAQVTYALSFKPADLTQIVKEAKVTILVGVPQLFTMLHKAIRERLKKIPFILRPFSMPLVTLKLRSQFRALRLLVSGGARLEPKVNRDLSRRGFKIIEGYGLTETSPIVTLNPPQKIKIGSVGKSIPDVEIKILDPDNAGVGEVLIKGPNVMQGYFKRPDLTAEVIKDSWFYSGDLGWIDKGGYLFLTGRKKDVIVLSSGKNIYPEELEEYYSKSPYIKQICVLSRQQEKFGRLIESLHAIIVPDLEYFRQKKEANIQLKMRWELENLAKALPSYQHIMGFTITKEELPATALRKIKRYEVRKKYLQAEPEEPQAQAGPVEFSEEDKAVLNIELAKKILNYMSGELKKPVSLDSHLEIDLGIDSLSRVELGLGLEALLKIKIPDELLYSISTVREIILNIQGFMGTGSAYKSESAQQKSWGQILKDLPAEGKLKKIRLQAGILDKLFTLIFKCLFLFIFGVFWRLKIKGREFFPKEGPYLICPNHASYLDGLVVFAGVPFSRASNTFFLGYSEIFELSLIRWAIKAGRLIPLDPAAHLTEALQYVSLALRHKKIVCIFPEGRRSIDENIQEFKKGTGILIKELGIPVIPAYIKGSHQAWPRTNRLPRPAALKIIFGRPVSLKELSQRQAQDAGLDDYEVIAKNLRQEVLKLVC